LQTVEPLAMLVYFSIPQEAAQHQEAMAATVAMASTLEAKAVTMNGASTVGPGVAAVAVVVTVAAEKQLIQVPPEQAPQLV
jgi:hypothetical protein